MNTDMDECLIQEVRQRPLLYDLGHIEYKCLRKKEIAWKEVAACLNLDETACKKRWKGLRDSYKRCKKMEKIIKRIGTKTPRRKWRYSKMMMFLDSVKTGKFNNDDSFEEYDYKTSTEDHDPIDMDSFESTLSLPEELELKEEEISEEHKESPPQSKFDKFLQLAASSISQTCSTLVEQSNERDSTALLFASLAAKIKEANMPMSVSNQIEAKVAALVFAEIEKYEDYICDVND